MAAFVKKSTTVLMVLSSLVFGGCKGELTPSTKAVRVGEAVGQTLCGIDTYESKSDSCVNASVRPISTGIKVVSNVTTPSRIILKDKLEILHVVEVKKGKGCIAATAMTPYPMSSSMCKEILAEHGFVPWVDYRNPMMQIKMEAIVPLGTRFVYVRGKRYTGWTIADTD